MSGFELQERLAVNGTGIPVIFITAHDDATTRERVKQSGIAACLRKPFDGQVLLDAIESAVRPAIGRPT
jgi:FixJ family two-component response regulator